MKRLTVAIYGNLAPSFSTESELAWTFKHLGHFVLPFQENATSTDDVLQGCINNQVNLLVYVHTHGWASPGSFPVEELFTRLRARGVVTATFHLDLHWGLHAWDKREDMIGVHPEWK